MVELAPCREGMLDVVAAVAVDIAVAEAVSVVVRECKGLSLEA